MSNRAPLPTVVGIDALAPAELPAFAALLALAGMRLQRLALPNAGSSASVTEAAT